MAIEYEKWSDQPIATDVSVLDKFLIIKNDTGESEQITWQTVYDSIAPGGVTDVTASSPLASSGGDTPNISIASPIPISLGGSGQTSLGTGLQVLRTNAGATGTEWATLAGSGTVTSVSVTTANGVSGSVANATTTPAITLTLGAITPSTVNGNTISTGTGTLTLSTFSLVATGNATITGSNTGDQTNISGNSFTTTNISGGIAGSIPYQTGASTTTFLNPSTNGFVLTLSGGLPVWAASGSPGVQSVTASSPLASTGGTTPNISLSGSIPIANGGTGRTSLGTALQVLRTNAAANATEWATISGSGTVTSVSVTTANGISGSVATSTTTPAITLTLGDITPTTVNGLTISSGGAYTLTVSNDATLYGINTGDQLNILGNAGSATTSTITNDNSTNAAEYITWTTGTSANLANYVSSTGLRFNPSTASLGIGFTAPTASLHVKGAGATSATYSEKILNSSSRSIRSLQNNGWMGLGTDTPNGAVDIWYSFSSSGQPTLLIGADSPNGSVTRTNSTDKVGLISFPHYTNATAPFVGILCTSTSTTNVLEIGGGTSAGTHPTEIKIWTAANNTTTSSNSIPSIDIISTGLVGINSNSVSASLHIAGTGSTSATFALKVDNVSNTLPIIHARNDVTVGIGMTDALAYLQIAAGTTTKAPFRLTSGTNKTTAASGEMEYNNTFHLTNSDATRRHIVLAPNTTKVTAGAPYTNDGYVVMNIGGTDFKVMTTA